jgi:UDP-N-acetylglucosamine 2-epimerase (non-hydrolysing)
LVVVTTHRRENWGEPIRNICRAIRRLVERFDDVEVLYSLHPNPLVKELAHAELGLIDRVHLVEAVNYGPWVKIMQRADLILTDSGGIQEEAPSLHKPVLVLRNVTERPEGVDAGVLKVVGTDSDVVYAESEHLLRDPVAHTRMTQAANPYGDGHAAGRIVRHIEDYLLSQQSAA